MRVGGRASSLAVVLLVATGSMIFGLPEAAASDKTIRIGDNFFTPSTVEIRQGDTVTWAWGASEYWGLPDGFGGYQGYLPYYQGSNETSQNYCNSYSGYTCRDYTHNAHNVYSLVVKQGPTKGGGSYGYGGYGQASETGSQPTAAGYHDEEGGGGGGGAGNEQWCATRYEGYCAIQFDDPGEFEYFCTIHPFMNGRIRVLAVDMIAPEVRILEPGDGFIVDDTITVSGIAWANDTHIDKIRIRIGDQPWFTAQGTSSWSATIDTTTVPNGLQKIDVRAWDGLGDYAWAERFVLVDNAIPTATVLAPASGALVGGTVHFTGVASSPHGVEQVEIRWANTTWQLTEGTGTWETTIDVTLDHPNGVHALEIVAGDHGGNLGYAYSEVVVSNPPTIEWELRDLSVSKSLLGYPIIRFDVAHRGNLDADTTILLEHEDRSGSWQTIDVLQHEAAAFTVATKTVHWAELGPVGDFPIRVRVDPSDLDSEPLEDNNELTGWAAHHTDLILGFGPDDL